MKRAMLAIAIALLPSLAPAQNLGYFCQFDETQSTVRCIKGGDAVPVFSYVVSTLNIFSLSTLASAPAGLGSASERCRLETERFREEQLEGIFRPSVESLRIRAESVRDESESNVGLYKQIMVIYSALHARYLAGLQTYKDTNRACTRITPYETRPNRLGGQDEHFHS